MPPYIPSDALIWLAAFGPPLVVSFIAFTAHHVADVLRGTGAQS